MRPSYGCWLIALALLIIATPGQARRLMEIDGIELRGTARVVAYGAAACHIRERNHSEEEYERLKVNEGKPLDLWQLEFSVYNGSGKALDHLIARYGIESPWPPCTNWSDNPGVSTTEALWSDKSGHIQRSGKPFSVAPGETLSAELFFIVFHEDEPRFANWSVDYNFAEGTHTAPGAQPPQVEAEPPAEQPAPTQAAVPQPAQASGLPASISAGETCAGKPKGAACWMELENQPGCYVWNSYLSVNETATWSVECASGLAEGTGKLTWVWGSDLEDNLTATGQLQQGKRQGSWVNRYADGTVYEGPYVDDKRHGQWVERDADGDVREGSYVDGKQHGQWVTHFASGDVWEGPYVDGKLHGHWVFPRGPQSAGGLLCGKCDARPLGHALCQRRCA